MECFHGGMHIYLDILITIDTEVVMDQLVFYHHFVSFELQQQKQQHQHDQTMDGS
jgi:hypothetical protein